MMDGSGATEAQIWLQEPIQFIDLMSKINIVKNDDAGSHNQRRRDEILGKHNGPNKDIASLFIAACRNAGLGCAYRSGSGGNLLRHEKICSFN